MKTKQKKESNENESDVKDMARLLLLFHACADNARDLLEEAIILGEASRFARATFLALTAYEEMGKAQLVADYASDCISVSEFENAFADHRTKAAYMARGIAVDCEALPGGKCRLTEGTIVYDKRNATYHVNKREKALYVSFKNAYDPIVPSSITKEEFESVMERVSQQFAEIEHAEWLNGRYGSKGLFK